MTVDEGQTTERWAHDWDGLTTEHQIQIWDFYGVRPYILRYVPRHGHVIEAGCGLGRVLFYLRRLGIDITGVDFEPETLERLGRWRDAHGIDCPLVQSDVCSLPYEDNALAGYISLGVVEHFIEGPHRPLAEAYRVLRPGGVAIVTTPSMSFSQVYKHAKQGAKELVKKLIGRRGQKPPFRQYWYTPGKLKRFVAASGLKVVDALGIDVVYSLYELGYRPLSDGLGMRLVSRWEETPLAHFGAQSVTISVKMAPVMHCFLCGECSVRREQMKSVVPICQGCEGRPEARWYRRGGRMSIAADYEVETPLEAPSDARCEYCMAEFKTDPIFETYGFTKLACPQCLKKPSVNIELSNAHIRRIWRALPRAGQPPVAGRALGHGPAAS